MKLASIALAALSIAIGSGAQAAPVGDPVAGEQVFKKCMACHSVGEGATNRIAPVLNDVFGRTAGTYEGYRYSQAMIDAGTNGLVWTHDNLTQYLPDPKAFVPGNKMTFAGLKTPEDVENVIAYLMQFSPNYASPDGGAAPAAAGAASAAPAISQ